MLQQLHACCPTGTMCSGLLAWPLVSSSFESLAVADFSPSESPSTFERRDKGRTATANHSRANTRADKPALRTERWTRVVTRIWGLGNGIYISGRRFGAGLKFFMIPLGEQICLKKWWGRQDFCARGNYISKKDRTCNTAGAPISGFM